MITAVLPGYYPTLVQNIAATPLVTPAAAAQQQQDALTARPVTNTGFNEFNALDDVNDLSVSQLRANSVGLPVSRPQTLGGGLVNAQPNNGALNNSESNLLLGEAPPPILGSGQTLGGTPSVFGNQDATQPDLPGAGNTLLGAGNTTITGTFDTTGVSDTGGLNGTTAADITTITAPLISEYNTIGASNSVTTGRSALDLIV